MRSPLRPRCVVLGLDGLPLTLARELASAGVLPNLAPFILSDKALGLDAELPELSPVNWTSFFTAAGPGDHGVYGFTRLHPYDYSTLFASFADVRMPTIFDGLAAHGLVSRVVNLPNTYPARPWRPEGDAAASGAIHGRDGATGIFGVSAAPRSTETAESRADFSPARFAPQEAVARSALVAGFLAPEMSRAVWPQSLLPELAALDYRLEPDTLRGGHDPELLLAEVRACLAGRVRLLDRLWRDLDFDCFVFVLTETDRLFHFLFPAFVEPDHPLRAECLEIMREVDRAAGALLERFDDLPQPKRLIMLADHGFTTLKTEVDLNAWLRQAGLLRLGGGSSGGPSHPADENDARRIDPRSRAFALDPGRVHVHRQGRFSRGSVAPDEADRLAGELREALMGITYEGEPVMEAVFRREELYDGACLAQAPDLVCLARPGFDLKAKFDRSEVFSLHHRRGAHSARDAFFYDSDGARPTRVREAGTRILDFFGAAPQNIGERPLIHTS